MKWWILVLGGFVLGLFVGVGVGGGASSGTTDDVAAPTSSAAPPVASTSSTAAASTSTTEPVTTTTATPTTTQPPTTTTQPPTTTTTLSLGDIQGQVIDSIVMFMESSDYDRVDVAVFDGEGTLVVEAKQKWASKDRQENVHFETVQFLAAAFSGISYDRLALVFEGDPIVHLTTVSTDGNYRYQSWTDNPSFVAIDGRQMGLDAWKDAADAAFQ